MEYTIPRILIAGTNSGCGKTTIVCAILQALVNRGISVHACKCGPDYIDPMFHSRIIGTPSSNLDPFFFHSDTILQLLAEHGSGVDLTVMEGVMGFYDGLGLDSAKASTWELSEITESPVILAVNARGASLSVLASIQGFLDFMPNHVCGVILNQCSPMTYPALADAIRKRFPGRAEPFGFLPVMSDCVLESRHLGLITAAEITDLQEKMQRLAEQAEKSICLDQILEEAGKAPEILCEPFVPHKYPKKVRIAVARDKAFCFYYEDSLNVLRDMGAELVDFSPLESSALPENIQGIYLGGGYPELYADALAANESMRRSLRDALQRGIPCIAECGGFMYLTGQIGEAPGVGFLPGRSFDTGKLQRFGYVTLTALQDNMLCRTGEQIRGHEFHHWDAEDTGNGFRAEKTSGRSWECVHVSERLYAGFPHFHFRANPAFAERFYEACLRVRNSNKNHGDQ